MKKFNILMLLSLFLAFTACENDEDRMYINPTSQVEAPVLTMDGLNDITVDVENINLIPTVLSWTHSNFGQNVLVEYSLEIADNKSFKDSLHITLGNNLYTYAPTNKQLSDWVINNFNGLNEDGEGVKRDLVMRIAATVALENPEVTIPPDMIYSNAVDISIMPYFVPAAFPSEMFMIGTDFGNWDWASDGVVTMTPVHTHEGHFWAIRYITADNGFKWCSQKAWGSDFFSLGEDLGFTTADGNAFVAEDGMYMIYMDMENGRISVEEAKVYGMGECFGGWNTGEYPFTIDGRTMHITTQNTNQLRMYAASEIAPSTVDWWQMEFVPRDGVIEYRGAGPDQEPRVEVEAGKKVTLDFNAGTATIE